jgi:hypothetical protein
VTSVHRDVTLDSVEDSLAEAHRDPKVVRPERTSDDERRVVVESVVRSHSSVDRVAEESVGRWN